MSVRRGASAVVVAVGLLVAPSGVTLPGEGDGAPPADSRELNVSTWYDSESAAGTPPTATATQPDVAAPGGPPDAEATDADPFGRAPSPPDGPWTISSALPAGDAVLVGAEWPPDARVRVQLRSSIEGSWSEWHELVMSAGEGPDPEGPEGARANWAASEPIWVGRVDQLQVRVAGAGAEPELTLHTVDVGGDDDLAFTPEEMRPARRGAAFAAVDRPNFIPRSSWDPNDDCPARKIRYADSARYAIIHHTATSTDYTSAQSANIVRSICLYHRNTLGWDHIGYNIVADKYGNVFAGRDGGVDKPVIGAHAAGFNTGSIGVSSIGCFDSSCSGSSSVWRSMLDAVDEVVAWKFYIHAIDPHGTTTETSGGSNKYPSGTKVTLPTIIGHLDVGKTACPGDRYYDFVDGREKMADRVAALMPEDIGLPRLAGGDRIATAIEISRWGFADATTVVIASAEAFPDGLAAGPLAGSLGGPVLLSPADQLPDDVAAEVRRLGASRAWLVGGSSRLSEQVEEDLVSKTGIPPDRIGRLAGDDRFDTAAEIGRAVIEREEPRVAILAVGSHRDEQKAFPDALSSSAFGAALGYPVLLVTADELPEATREVLAGREWPGGLYVIGGENAISDAVVVEAMVTARVTKMTRLAGDDRYATSVSVTDEWLRVGGDPALTLFATGRNWPDALTAGAATAAREAAFLLVDGGDLERSSASKSWVEQRADAIDEGWIAGGTTVVSDQVSRDLAGMIR